MNALHSTYSNGLDSNFGLNPITNFLPQAIEFINKVADYLLGIVGQIMLLPITLPLMLIAHIALYFSHRIVKKAFMDLDRDIVNCSEDFLIDYHLLLEDKVLFLRRIENNYNPSKATLLSRPLANKAFSTYHLVYEMESKLKKHIYPDLGKKPSQLDLERLAKTFEDMPELRDPELDIYEKLYC
ncbi:hypothetical protein N7E81_11595 [Reichenbachiella carrageenanivorans]|uniref:Uncharacterized protein n=1 Tax=Reichenbachiella carrageenanivorans TaxID=2979869 RepID=A0ABY6CXC7_9BACT|nr:hypothetical protein [Reichenbachiella carrageenanivorans]UXX78004.1 hypothetical protein N7E81_11595 [Reichenbachiella carrageenanivorans]